MDVDLINADIIVSPGSAFSKLDSIPVLPPLNPALPSGGLRGPLMLLETSLMRLIVAVDLIGLVHLWEI